MSGGADTFTLTSGGQYGPLRCSRCGLGASSSHDERNRLHRAEFLETGSEACRRPGHKMKTAESAIDRGKRLAPSKAGVVVYQVDYDAQVDMTSDPKILFKAGQLPPELAGE